MESKSFILYKDQWQALKELSFEGLGQLLNGIFRYLNGDEVDVVERSMPNEVLLAFRFMMIQINIDLAKYTRRLEQQRERTRKYREKSDNSDVTQVTRNNDNDKDSDKDSDKDEDKDEDNSSIAAKKKISDDARFYEAAWRRDFVKWYNGYIVNNNSRIPQIRFVTDKRSELIKEIFKKFELDDRRKVMILATTSDFLNGRGKKNTFVANFEWIFNSENFMKILEGYYN